MQFTITPGLVRDLAESGAHTPAIVLGPDGWSVQACPEGVPGGYTSLTLEGIDAWSGGADLEDDDYAALATDEYGGHFDIERRGAEREGDWRVVFPTGEAEVEYAGPELWRECYAIDLSAATLVLADPSVGERHDLTAWSALWRTAEGEWVRECESLHVRSRGYWLEAVSADVVAAEVYALPDERRLTEDVPVLVRAARAAADLVKLCAAPTVPEGTDAVRMPGAIARIADEAVEVFGTARVIQDLLRNTAVPALRDQRRSAGWTVVRDEDNNQAEAARRLGIAPPTLNQILHS